MATAVSRENNENEIRKLVDSWAAAVAAKDIDAIIKALLRRRRSVRCSTASAGKWTRSIQKTLGKLVQNV